MMKANILRTILFCGTAMAVPAMAQEPLQVRGTAPTADAAEVGDIIVTAGRREERLQNVPVSVTADRHGPID